MRVIAVRALLKNACRGPTERHGRNAASPASRPAPICWRADVYVGRLEGDVDVRGFASGIPNRAVGSTDLRREYLGLYGTWTAGTGLYADAVLQAGRHRYTVNPLLGIGAEGKGDSLMASVKAGQSFDLGGGWQIEPQLQLIHQQMDLDDVRIVGAVVQQDSHSGWIARAGLRVKGMVATGAGSTLVGA